MKSMRHFAAIAILIASTYFELSASSALAQQPSREDRLRAIDWFVVTFVAPTDACIVAGKDDLARFDEVLAGVRKEYLRAFELVEATKEYAATLIAMRRADDGRFAGPHGQRSAQAECLEKASQILSAHRQRRHAEAFEQLIKIFSSSI
jgi:hypothetical protein